MGLPKTHQEYLLFSLEILLKKTKVIPPEECHNGEYWPGWRMLQLRGWIMIKKNTQLELKTWFLTLKEFENSNTLTTTMTGSKNSQKEANNQTAPPMQWD